MDICTRKEQDLESIKNSFDVTICQATLEHLYDPCQAMINIAQLTKNMGLILVHTHTPEFGYHAFPRDYFRFSPDWFEDISSVSKDLSINEIISSNGHILASIKKTIFQFRNTYEQSTLQAKRIPPKRNIVLFFSLL